MIKKVLIILSVILLCIICKASNKKDFDLINTITTDCVNNSNYSYDVCYNYAFTLIKTGEENLLYYSYNVNK